VVTIVGDPAILKLLVGEGERTGEDPMQGEESDDISVTSDPLHRALRVLVFRDLIDSELYGQGESGWTPVTIEYARRLRELNERYHLWPEEPHLVRAVLDGARFEAGPHAA
jgi:hypothetical protein